MSQMFAYVETAGHTWTSTLGLCTAAAVGDVGITVVIARVRVRTVVGWSQRNDRGFLMDHMNGWMNGWMDGRRDVAVDGNRRPGGRGDQQAVQKIEIVASSRLACERNC